MNIQLFEIRTPHLYQPGFIHVPDKPNGDAIIWVNAQGIDSLGQARAFFPLSEDLCSRGYHVIRFEPCYESIGDYDPEELFSYKQVIIASMQSVIDFVKTEIKPERIHIGGFCLGANLIFPAKELFGSVSSLILLDMDEDVLTIGEKFMNEGQNQESTGLSYKKKRDNKKRFKLYLQKGRIPDLGPLFSK
jgi:hypothetical protein